MKATTLFAAATALVTSVSIAACSGDTTGSTEAVAVRLPSTSLSIVQGGQISIDITADRTDYNGPVAIFASKLPIGVTADVDTIARGETTGHITLTARADALPSTSTLVIGATAANARVTTASALFAVTVRGSYSMSLTQDTFYVTSGTHDLQTDVRLSRTNGFTGEVTIAGAAGEGITAVPASPYPSVGVETVRVMIHVPGGLQPGDYVAEVRTSTPGLADRVARVVIRVSPATPFVVLNSGAPLSARVLVGSVSSTTFAVQRGGGFAGPVVITTSGLPSGVTASVSQPGATGTTAVITVTAAAGVKTGSYPFMIEANAGEAVSTRLNATAVVTAPASLRKLISADQQVGVTGTVSLPPSVEVLDANNIPIAGVDVVFVPQGLGRVTGATAVTDGTGKATVGSWAVDTIAMRYVLAAYVPGLSDTVTFGAKAVGGAAARLTEVAGNNQKGHAQLWLPGSLVVKAWDRYGNSAPGATVNFKTSDPTSGIPGISLQVTDTAGRASTSWLLGTAQVQTMTARIGALPPVEFTAESMSCALAGKSYVLGTTVEGYLDGYNSCPLPNVDEYGEYYMFTLTEQQTFGLFQNVESGSSYITDASGNTAASPFHIYGTQGIETIMVLPAGTYRLTAAVGPYDGSSYQFATTKLAMIDLAGCTEITTIPGVTITGTVNSIDCVSPAGRFDRVRFYGTAGRPVTVSVASSGNTILQVNQSSTQSPTPSLTFTPVSSGMYEIRVYNPSPSTTPITYTLTIR